jgi:hypothetical protein
LLHLLFFAFKEEEREEERTSKPVFHSILVKWHLVYAAAIVTLYCSKNIQERRRGTKTTTAARSQEWLLAE